MSEQLSSSSTQNGFKPSFYFWMTLVMTFFVFAGFGMTYWLPLASGNFPPAPPVVHLHGLVFSTWMILLVVQAALVNFRNVALHRSLGTWGIAHATLVVYTGALISLLGMDSINNPILAPTLLDAMFLSYAAVCGFSILFILAIRNVRRPEIHKRLVLFAILPILPPGVNRFYMVPFELDYIPVVPLYLTLGAMAVAILIQEQRSNGKISAYSWIGAGWIFMQAAVHVPFANSETFKELCRFSASLIYYR